MANTIRLKRASGSDPGASDLVTGELAVRTDTAKLFTKKDDNSVAEIGASVGTDDVDTAAIQDDAVTFAKIQNIGNNKIAGRISSGTGNIEQLSAANVRSIINVEDGATADQTKSDIDGLGIAASTAATLATARTIAGVSFNGSANISLNNNAITNGAGYITGSSLNASNLSSGTIPDARFPSTLPAVSGANLTNISATVAGGAVYENAQSIDSDYTVTNGKNAMSAGPIEILSGVTVTVGSGETYTIV